MQRNILIDVPPPGNGRCFQMPEKPKKDDLLFGRVTVDGDWWYGTHHSAWTSQNVEILLPVEDKDAGPSSVQRRLFQEFRSKEMSLQRNIETAIFRWYRRYVKHAGHDFDYPFPDVARCEDIWKAIKFSSICIPDRNDDDRFEILFGGEWETEHGFFVALKKWEIIDVLYQGSGY